MAIEEQDHADSEPLETLNDLQDSVPSEEDQLPVSVSALLHSPQVSRGCAINPSCSKLRMNSEGGAGGALAPEDA